MFACLILACSIGGACREVPGEDGARSLSRLVLEAEDVELEREVDVVARLPVPPGLDPWTVSGEAHRMLPSRVAEVDATVLRLAGRDSICVGIPAAYPAAECDRVLVSILGTKQGVLRAALVLDDGSRIGALTHPSIGTRGRSDLELAFPHEGRDAGRGVSQVELVFAGMTGSIELHAVTLLSVSALRALPRPSGGQAHVDVGGELRLGFGVSSQSPLRSKFTAPRNGVLAFAAAWPPAVRELGGTATLRYEVVDADGTSVTGGKLELQGEARPSWTPVRVDLAPLGGRQLEVRFRVEPSAEIAQAGAHPDPVLCAISDPLVYPAEERPRTVLLVTSDTHRFDHVGAAQAGLDVETPAFDALAARGWFFEDCFSPSNLTVPSHVTLLSGVHPRDTRVLDNNVPLAPEARTLAEAFRAAGYETLAVTSACHLGDKSGLTQGFDRFSFPRGDCTRSADESVDRLLEWLDEAHDRPVFAWLHLFDAHTPYALRPELVERFYTGDPRDPALPEPNFRQPPDHRDVRDPEFGRALYKSEVAFLDRELGRLFAHERAAGAVIALTADHGESLGEHDIWWDHAGLFAQSVHVPLILAGPGLEPRRIGRPVELANLGRTLLDLASVEEPAFPGVPLTVEQPAVPRFVLAQGGQQASITAADKHLVLNLFGGGRQGRTVLQRHAVALFDLARDPACERDLAAVDPGTAARLRTLLVEWLQEARDDDWAGATHADAETLRELAELGYLVESADESTGWKRFIDPNCSCAACRALRD